MSTYLRQRARKHGGSCGCEGLRGKMPNHRAQATRCKQPGLRHSGIWAFGLQPSSASWHLSFLGRRQDLSSPHPCRHDPKQSHYSQVTPSWDKRGLGGFTMRKPGASTRPAPTAAWGLGRSPSVLSLRGNLAVSFSSPSTGEDLGEGDLCSARL